MKRRLTKENFNQGLKELQAEYKIFAPKALAFKGTFSDTDSIRYGEISSIDEIEFERKSHFSPKEVLLPLSQTLFYFTEEEYKEPSVTDKKFLVFMRACDVHSIKRLDEIYLRNAEEDFYYKRLRDKISIVLIGCEKSYRNCFCVSMGSNKTQDYDIGLKIEDENILLDIKESKFDQFFKGNETEFEVDCVTSNDTVVNVPKNLTKEIINSDVWDEYDSRCIACGKCNFVCPTCTCFSMQDIFYKDNKRAGERRRVWASCQVDGFTEVAGGHEYRKKHGQRMRFKALHKVYDFNKRYDYHMCVGCGRCDDACPEYISFSSCINKLDKLTKEAE